MHTHTHTHNIYARRHISNLWTFVWSCISPSNVRGEITSNRIATQFKSTKQTQSVWVFCPRAVELQKEGGSLPYQSPLHMQDLLGGSGRTRLRLLKPKTWTQYIRKNKTSQVASFKDKVYFGCRGRINTVVAAESLTLADDKTKVCVAYRPWAVCSRPLTEGAPASLGLQVRRSRGQAEHVLLGFVRSDKALVIPSLGRNKRRSCVVEPRWGLLFISGVVGACI